MIIDRYVIQKRDELFLQNVMHEMLGDPEPYGKQRYWKLIDNWKAYLTNEYGLRKGDVVGIGLVKNNVQTTALLFALAELGAQVFASSLSWNRDAKIDYPATTIKAEFGLWDSVAVRMLDSVQRDYYDDNLPYEMIQVDSVDIENYTEPMEIEQPEVFPDDPFWITHADGEHEDGLEFQYYTHKECWSLAHRQFKMFNYYDGLGIHTFNSVHCMSFINAVLPAMMGCKEHYFVNWWDRLNMWKPQMVHALQKLFKRPEKKVIWFKNEETLERSLNGLQKEDFDGSTCHFVCPFSTPTPFLHELVKEKGIKCSLFYGETRSKSLTLFVKPIREEYVEGSVGFILDNYYECVYSPQKLQMFVRGHEDTAFYPLSFRVQKMSNGEYVYMGSVAINPYHERVEHILGHHDFFLLRKYGKNYLCLFEEPEPKVMALLENLGLTQIEIIDRMAYCLENSRYRDWFALKNAFEYGYESFEEGRVRYYDGKDRDV